MFTKTLSIFFFTFALMAGHSKWANIRRRKERQDAKKTHIYNKVLKEIAAAAHTGGVNSEENARLRMAIQNAKAANVPKENIARAIKKGGNQADGSYIEVAYEGYAPGGVAIIVQGMTNNLNRTIAHVRSLFGKYGGSLAKQGSIAHLFDHQGYFLLARQDFQKEAEERALDWIEAGAEDIIENKEGIEIFTLFTDFGRMQKSLEKSKVIIQEAYPTYTPHTLLQPKPSDRKRIEELIQALHEDDDIQNVYHNLAPIA